MVETGCRHISGDEPCKARGLREIKIAKPKRAHRNNAIWRWVVRNLETKSGRISRLEFDTVLTPSSLKLDRSTRQTTVSREASGELPFRDEQREARKHAERSNDGTTGNGES
ncbi:hypothetical protein, unlikely [Trypanosoma brucei gambiense DAL972]|uniref:Uncharacterized protein n=1 Tax=Trypanosoma brucei gambiense (strain MHOM/CI/86/DAL972) TaxID=679716 RepID=D0A3E3_TRYB9|nr:hypothetical protein, unlikely [Trypanosoma brucei gambiense DAL972]CBH15787.1 hypothetical protein, unlikely [Trypanosoma brucei gambiense DAL972]|eukprot:XP_011778051.1 hypothetical protein, unlikely [Trypanosoma brucei gambiense DAL972]